MFVVYNLLLILKFLKTFHNKVKTFRKEIIRKNVFFKNKPLTNIIGPSWEPSFARTLIFYIN